MLSTERSELIIVAFVSRKFALKLSYIVRFERGFIHLGGVFGPQLQTDGWHGLIHDNVGLRFGAFCLFKSPRSLDETFLLFDIVSRFLLAIL